MTVTPSKFQASREATIERANFSTARRTVPGNVALKKKAYTTQGSSLAPEHAIAVPGAISPMRSRRKLFLGVLGLSVVTSILMLTTYLGSEYLLR